MHNMCMPVLAWGLCQKNMSLGLTCPKYCLAKLSISTGWFGQQPEYGSGHAQELLVFRFENDLFLSLIAKYYRSMGRHNFLPLASSYSFL